MLEQEMAALSRSGSHASLVSIGSTTSQEVARINTAVHHRPAVTSNFFFYQVKVSSSERKTLTSVRLLTLIVDWNAFLSKFTSMCQHDFCLFSSSL